MLAPVDRPRTAVPVDVRSAVAGPRGGPGTPAVSRVAMGLRRACAAVTIQPQPMAAKPAGRQPGSLEHAPWQDAQVSAARHDRPQWRLLIGAKLMEQGASLLQNPALFVLLSPLSVKES